MRPAKTDQTARMRSAQSDLSLLWSNKSYCSFIMRWLKVSHDTMCTVITGYSVILPNTKVLLYSLENLS